MALTPWVDEILAPAPGFTDTSPRYSIITPEGTIAYQNVKIILQNVIDTLGTEVSAENVNLMITLLNDILAGTQRVGDSAKLVGRTEAQLSVANAATLGGKAEAALSVAAAVNATNAAKVPWSGVISPPATYAPSAHNQSAATVLTGTFPQRVVAAAEAEQYVAVLRNIISVPAGTNPASLGVPVGTIICIKG